MHAHRRRENRELTEFLGFLVGEQSDCTELRYALIVHRADRGERPHPHTITAAMHDAGLDDGRKRGRAASDLFTDAQEACSGSVNLLV